MNYEPNMIKANERFFPLEIDPECPWQALVEPYGGEDPNAKLKYSDRFGIVRFELFCSDTIGVNDTSHNYSRVPTVLIDDVPVASGFGSLQVAVPEGNHIVTVQAWNLVHSATSIPIHVKSFTTSTYHYSALHYLEMYAPPRLSDKRRRAFPATMGGLGRPGAQSLNHLGCLSPTVKWFLIGSVLAMLVFWVALFGLFYVTDTWDRPPEQFVCFALPFVIAGGIAAAMIRNRRWNRRNADVIERDRKGREFPLLTWETEQPAIESLQGLGTDVVDAPPQKSQYATVVIRVALAERSLHLAGSSHHPKPHTLWRTPTRPPELRFTGQKLPSAWNTWYLKVVPGLHTLEIDRSRFSDAPERLDLHCDAGTVTTVEIKLKVSYHYESLEISKVETTWDISQKPE